MALVAVLLVAIVGALVAIAVVPQRGKVTTPDQKAEPAMRLPDPVVAGGMAVAEAIARRRSIREFSPKPLEPAQIAQLCWAAQGITDDRQGYRAAPSAGALYPITVFIVDRASIREYDPQSHALRNPIAGDVRRQLRTAAHDQACIESAPVCMVITIDVDKTAVKYGDRAERYCLLEAGHVAQNVLLQATAMGLGGVPVGAFDDRQVAAILRLPQRLRPVYLLPLGFAADSN